MFKALIVFVCAICFAAFCAAISAQQLPKSGSISIHTGWKDVGEAIEVAEKRMQGHGSVMGINFNDKGSGPLHLGPATCFYAFFAVDGNGKTKGYCAFSDADGDKIFTDFTGSTTPDGQGNGINEIAGGTGKYSGIQGNGPWKCKYASANGHLGCTQRFDYRLP